MKSKLAKPRRSHKYYAVASGRRPGIYTSWPTAHKQVNCFSGAVFQGFSDYSDAMTFLYAYGDIPDTDHHYLEKTIPQMKLTTNVNVQINGSTTKAPSSVAPSMPTTTISDQSLASTVDSHPPVPPFPPPMNNNHISTLPAWPAFTPPQGQVTPTLAVPPPFVDQLPDPTDAEISILDEDDNATSENIFDSGALDASPSRFYVLVKVVHQMNKIQLELDEQTILNILMTTLTHHKQRLPDHLLLFKIGSVSYRETLRREPNKP
jgi:hypothetical protein